MLTSSAESPPPPPGALLGGDPPEMDLSLPPLGWGDDDLLGFADDDDLLSLLP